MKFGSLFTGVGGFDLGLERAGMECAWQVEQDRYCNQVLEKHWEGVSRYEDVGTVGRNNLSEIDLICGGFPCQDLSVAGKGAGLSGKRSGLWFEFERIIGEMRPRWFIIENVPGLLNKNHTTDFQIILKSLDEFGYGVAWRILDSQYFGVAQRRRRVFIVGSLGSGRSAEVLFECEGMSGNTPPSRQEGKGIARTFGFSPQDGGRDVSWQEEKSPTLRKGVKHGDTMLGGQPQYLQEPAGSLDFGGHGGSYNGQDAYNNKFVAVGHSGGGQVPNTGVRRLTPTECCRLQGFPDDWNDICSDTQRYKQMGNAVTVNVIEWIGKRIMEE